MKKILVVGAAGFIGSAVAKKLTLQGNQVIGIDDFNDAMYPHALKEDRVTQLFKGLDIPIHRVDIRNKEALEQIIIPLKPDKICHLAARAGVRNSLLHPEEYEQVNVQGTIHMLEIARKLSVENMVIASSSSVYGNNTKIPFSENDRVDHPISPYAATKKMNELISYTYHHLYGLPVTNLRFFTVYGPWGRPDMAMYKFSDLIRQKKPIEIYNFGNMRRDFTFIDDIVSGIIAALEKNLPYEIINLGNNHPEELLRVIDLIENGLHMKAIRKMLPMQPGDVPETFADISKAKSLLGYKPETNIESGIKQFIDWYASYYHLN